MRLHRQWLLGLVICSIILENTFCQLSINDKESHQVYSYTYHFQHNGNTDPKQFIHDILPDPPQGGSLVKTFDKPELRGFVSKGFLPAGPLNHLTNNNQPFITPNLQDIKAIVQDNLNRNPVQPPASPISENFKNINREVNNQLNKNRNNFDRNFNNIDREVNNQLNKNLNNFGGNFNNINREVNNQLNKNLNNFGGNFNKFPQVTRPRVFQNQGPPPYTGHNNNNVISNVQTFEKDIPNGKVIERIETLSYNPPPIENSVTIKDGNGHQVNRQNHNAFGRTVSYFRKEFSNSDNFKPNNNFFDRNTNNNNDRSQWWNSVGVSDINNKPQDFDRQWNNIKSKLGNSEQHNPEEIPVKKVANQEFIRPVFGQRIRNNLSNLRAPENQIINNHNQHGNRNLQNNNIQDFDKNFADQRGNFQNEFNNRNSFQNDRTSANAFNIIENVNNRLKHVDNRLQKLEPRNFGRTFTWDDDEEDDKNWHVNTESDWSKRSQQTTNNWDVFNQGNTAYQNPVDALKSTLQALVGKQINIPNIPVQNGNGLEKTFNVDRVVEGPNSFFSDRRRGFERNFRTDTDNGYHRANQWSTNFERRLDAQSSRDEFSKDFIDVFKDDF